MKLSDGMDALPTVSGLICPTRLLGKDHSYETPAEDVLDRLRVTTYESIVCKMSYQEYAALSKKWTEVAPYTATAYDYDPEPLLNKSWGRTAF